ncbi:MAG: AMP-binding protein [Gammaproteobacteria bacterium]|nr:AMP-binding protein [Gammaproteobacteria bacterium]
MLDLGTTLLAAVERDPDALAIVDGDRRTTYAQWLGEIGRIAAALTALPIDRGERLVVALQNRHEMATLHWACQMIGVVMTPVNWRAKPDELDFVLTDAEAKAVVFEDTTASTVAAAKTAQRIPRIGIRGADGATLEFDALSAHDKTLASSRATARDWSLMLYTSGTTGRGKGVPRRHYPERAAALAHVAQNRYGYGETTLGVMPLYHTMGVRSLLAMALINGCFVCLPRFFATRALELIESEKVSNLYLVPTLYHDLLADSNFSAADISSVRKLGFAGAPMTDGLLQRLVDAFQPELFVNHYGSSEIYTFTICPDAHVKPGSAGKAGLNQRIRVVEIGATDPMTTLQANQEGQIIASLASDEAFEGYWNRPDADRKALHDGWYFTGDIGYWDRDGDLFVTGRVDDMIISGGENIMPVEVESVLSLHPAVAEVAVAGITDQRLGQRTVAYIKRRSDVDDASLDSYCRASGLADFKRPREYIFVQDVPKSPVGKILRRLLVAGEYEVDE